ncbi:MAG: Txe/YoeB family addiction module toxin [Alphaproteobacteria bacterium]|nr:Txe/YoeB family addiction module toxin [Alphaproteobacteria bacterium]
MVKYTLYYTSSARKDAKKCDNDKLRKKIEELLKITEEDPYKTYPPYEALCGDLKGCYSRRINVKHRLVYEVIEEKKAIKVLRLWTHYE